MTAPFWAKLWIEIVDDPKMAKMPDWLFRRFIYFLLVAKEYDHRGLLQPVDDLAWRLRISNDECTEALQALEKVGVARNTSDGWELINFIKRQERDVTDSALRMRDLRARRKENVTCDVTSDATGDASHSSSALLCSSSDSLTSLNGENHKSSIPNERDIYKVFAEVTTMVSIPASDKRGEYIESIYQMLQSYGYDETKRRMKSAYDTWIQQHSKNGRQYSRTNLAWINYAIADESLGSPPELSREEQIKHDLEVMTKRNQ